MDCVAHYSTIPITQEQKQPVTLVLISTCIMKNPQHTYETPHYDKYFMT
jgi:hypothetical protein